MLHYGALHELLREAKYPNLEDFVYLFCARAMVTVYIDIRLHSADGFFAIDSRFAEPMTLDARRSGAGTATSVSTIHRETRENEDLKKELMLENESPKKHLAESKAYAKKQEKLAADRKMFGEKVTQRRTFQQRTVHYGDVVPEGYGVLRNTSHSFIPKQWREEM